MPDRLARIQGLRPMCSPGRSDDRGMVTAFVVVMVTAIIFVAGLVYDGGNILAAHREADRAAEQAARAGAQGVSEDALRGQQQFDLDAADAVARAEQFLAAHGYNGSARVQDGEVIVTVSITQPLSILGIGGLSARTVTGSGSARPLFGIDEPIN